MLPCFELNRIPKKDIFDSKKFLVIFTVILCSTALTSILSCVRYVSEQMCKVTCFSYVVFLFFFQLNGFCRTRFFVISRFLPKIISLCQAVQLAFLSTRRRERYSPVNQILQLADLSSPRKEGLKLIFSLWLSWWSPWRRVACVYVKRLQGDPHGNQREKMSFNPSFLGEERSASCKIWLTGK